MKNIQEIIKKRYIVDCFPNDEIEILKILISTLMKQHNIVDSKTLIKKENTKLYGSPAIEYHSYLRSYAHFRTLPDVTSKLTELQKEIDNLKNCMNQKKSENK